jgi:serine/threonine protein kinase
MGEPINPGKGSSEPPKPAANGPRDTVLLGDIPEISELMPEAAPQALNLPHLSSTALAALSQRYELLGEAGHGSMGNVYKARDRETGEIVALKLLKPEIASDQAMMDRFKNELLFARKITHKNVCRVHEFNRLGGIAYTSMEFVEGESLRSVLNRFGGLPLRKATDLVLQICSGLREAHAQGIVHRDLKPENIMIDANGNVKIMDFGIARSMEAVTRMTGSMVGTPAYMAPEQVAGKPVDYRTDIYSLGLILYEMFTGTAAFRADNAVAVALKQMRESPVPPHEIDPQIPVAIERTILKCLEKEPEKRFQSIAELESAIRGQAATGTQTSASAAPAPVSATRSTHPTLKLPSPDSRAMTSSKKRTSPVVWVLLGVLLAFTVLAAGRSAQIKREAEALPPPVPLPAPQPPEFAFEIPPRSAAQPPPAPAPAPVAKPKPAPAAPAKQAEAPKADQPASPQQDAQGRADKAVGEGAREKFSAAAANGRAFIWVGRYDREKGARDAAKKVHDLGGFQARVAPRWGDNGEFFVVWCGPVPRQALADNLDWLHAQGFNGAHEFKLPTFDMTGRGNQGKGARGQNQGQAPNQ